MRVEILYSELSWQKFIVCTYVLLVFHVIILYFLGKRNEISLATVIKNEIQLDVPEGPKGSKGS